jgi:hypothetical protein
VPSSISSSDAAAGRLPDGPADRPAAGAPAERDRYARQTAADRPGVAQPVPVRPVPEQPWGKILLGTVVLFALLLSGWEAYWRAYGVKPGISNSYGLWSIQRRRLDTGEGNATVLVGDSRMYFDLQLPVWQHLDGSRPIQLSFEGTSALVMLEDLAADPHFTGRVLVGISPQVFFQGSKFRAGAVAYTHRQSPSQRIGQWLSMHLIEPYFAFDDSDYALETVLERQPWPVRPGKDWHTDVRELARHETDRNTHLWSKVVTDPQYRELARDIWRQRFQLSEDPPPEKLRKMISEEIAQTAKAVATLRARGVQVLFVRMPSDGEYLVYENRLFPRATTWDALLAATGEPGIHFQDYPQLQGYYLPEWSHMTQADAERFTAALYGIVKRDFWRAGADAAAARATVGVARTDPPHQR